MRKAYSYIRMSTNIQLKGDSLRRQLELSELYAKNNNLELVDSIEGINLQDVGVSGYRGVNSQKGVLAVFLECLEKGSITNDSVLLVESLDRLSRNTITDAMTQFLNIISKGIEIITLVDNQKYSKERIDKDIGSLYISLGIMQRAYEESATKSSRLQAVWRNKRENGHIKKLSGVCPAWFKLNKDSNQFEAIPDRAKVVTKIFDMCINTCGLYGIARYLNEANTPVFGTGKFWYRSYIKKIITNRSVLGEFQPYTTIEGIKTASGDPLINYYPQVVTEDIFNLANAALARRDVSEKGRKGPTFTNIFTGIAYCGDCGTTMSVRNRGATGGISLHCNNKLQGGGCEMSEWNSKAVELAILNHIKEIDFSTLINPNDEPKSFIEEIEALKAKEQIKKHELDNALNLSISTELNAESKLIVIQKLNFIQTEINDLQSKIQDFLSKENEYQQEQNLFKHEELKLMIKLMDEKSDDFYFRSSVNQLLRKTITRIVLIDPKEVLHEWELDEDSPVLKKYRLLYESNAAIEKIAKSINFKRFFAQYFKRFAITYRTGIIRHILLGENLSFAANNHLVKISK